MNSKTTDRALASIYPLGSETVVGQWAAFCAAAGAAGAAFPKALAEHVPDSSKPTDVLAAVTAASARVAEMLDGDYYAWLARGFEIDLRPWAITLVWKTESATVTLRTEGKRFAVQVAYADGRLPNRDEEKDPDYRDTLKAEDLGEALYRVRAAIEAGATVYYSSLRDPAETKWRPSGEGMTAMEAMIYAGAFGAAIVDKEHPALAAAAREFAVTAFRGLEPGEVMVRFPNMGADILRAHREAAGYKAKP